VRLAEGSQASEQRGEAMSIESFGAYLSILMWIMIAYKLF
jgi:hypothetical protein